MAQRSSVFLARATRVSILGSEGGGTPKMALRWATSDLTMSHLRVFEGGATSWSLVLVLHPTSSYVICPPNGGGKIGGNTPQKSIIRPLKGKA